MWLERGGNYQATRGDAVVKKPARRWMWLWWGIILGLLGTVPAQAADLLDRVRNQEINQVLRLKVGRSKVLRTPFALTRISVADPDIADLILISEREIYINALAPGATNISMWGKSRFTSATVTVEADLTLLKEKLHQILPKEKIGAEAAGDSIVLSGEVSGPVAQSTALALALPFAGGKKDKVVNVLHVGGRAAGDAGGAGGRDQPAGGRTHRGQLQRPGPRRQFRRPADQQPGRGQRPGPGLHRGHPLLFRHLLHPGAQHRA